MRIYLFLSMLCTLNAIAQQAPIAIVSANGATKLVNTLDEAAQQAQDNDIIYLPAGNLAGQTIKHFDKKVTVIGVGHHPDSASAMGRTYIDGNIGFYVGAEGSTLDGVYVTGGVYVSSSCKFFRVNADHFHSPGNWPSAEDLLLNSCIARSTGGTGISFAGSAGDRWSSPNAIIRSKIQNSIIGGNFTHQTGANTFENCIFLYSGPYGIEQAGSNTYINCIFPNITDWGGPASATFTKCIFITSSLPPLVEPGSSSGNILGQNSTAILENAPGNMFAYENNYRLKATSPGKNAGTDGKDIGIYGGATPYRDGAVPPNPSVRSQQINAETTPSGTLRVKFNVRVN